MASEAAVADLLLALAVIIVVAKVFEELISWRGYPPVLGDILAGLVLGPSILDILTPNIVEELDLLKWIGIISLLFLAGMETKFTEFMKSLHHSFWIAFGGIISSFLMGYAAGLLLGYPQATCLFIGAVLTATSVGLTVKVLSDIGAIAHPIASSILGAAVLDDVGGLIVLGLTVAMVSSGGARIEDLLVTAGVAITFYVFLILALHRGSAGIWRWLTRLGHLQDTIISILFALTLIVAWASVKVNLSLVVGAYAVGLAFSEVRGARAIIERFSLIPNIFSSIFFVLSAAMIDIKPYLTHLEYIVPIIVIVAVAIISKILGCGLAAKLSGLSFPESLFTGIGMIPRAEVALVITSLGLAYGVLNDEVVAGVIILIYVTSILTPILLTRLWKIISKRKG